MTVLIQHRLKGLAVWCFETSSINWWFNIYSYWSHGPVESLWVFPLIAWWIFPLFVMWQRLPECTWISLNIPSDLYQVYTLIEWDLVKLMTDSLPRSQFTCTRGKSFTQCLEPKGGTIPKWKVLTWIDTYVWKGGHFMRHSLTDLYGFKPLHSSTSQGVNHIFIGEKCLFFLGELPMKSEPKLQACHHKNQLQLRPMGKLQHLPLSNHQFIHLENGGFPKWRCFYWETHWKIWGKWENHPPGVEV